MQVLTNFVRSWRTDIGRHLFLLLQNSFNTWSNYLRTACLFSGDCDAIKVHNHAEIKWGQYPAILTEQPWSIYDLGGKKNTIFLAGQTAGNPARVTNHSAGMLALWARNFQGIWTTLLRNRGPGDHFDILSSDWTIKIEIKNMKRSTYSK